MATKINGTFADNNNNINFWLEYTITQSQDDNTSTLSMSMKVKKVTSYATTKNSSTPYSLTIAGTVVKSGTYALDFSNAAVGTTKTIFTYTKTYTHNDNGTLGNKSVSAVFDLSDNNPGKGTASGTLSFSTIARAATITSVTSSVALGGTATVVIDIKSRYDRDK